MRMLLRDLDKHSTCSLMSFHSASSPSPPTLAAFQPDSSFPRCKHTMGSRKPKRLRVCDINDPDNIPNGCRAASLAKDANNLCFTFEAMLNICTDDFEWSGNYWSVAWIQFRVFSRIGIGRLGRRGGILQGGRPKILSAVYKALSEAM